MSLRLYFNSVYKTHPNYNARVMSTAEEKKRDKFFEYILTLNVEGVRRILKEEPGWFHILSAVGERPLFQVCKQNPEYVSPAGHNEQENSDRQLQIVDILIENGARGIINQCSPRQHSYNPLRVATTMNNRRLVRHLLDLGANPNYLNSNLRILETAFRRRKLYDIAVLLILYGADPTNVRFGELGIISKEDLPDDLQKLIANYEILKGTLKEIDRQKNLSPLERATERALVLGRTDFLDFFLKWTPTTHPEFKQGFKDTVRSVLLSGYRENSHVRTTDGTQIPPEILFQILSFAGRPGDDESARGRVFSRSSND